MEQHAYHRLKQLLSDYLSSGSKLELARLTECLSSVTAAQKYELVTRRQNQLGNSVIHVAAFSDHTDIIECLLESFAPDVRCELLKTENRRKANAMHCAAMSGHAASISSMLKTLTLEERFELVKVPTRMGKTAVHFASVGGHTNTMQAILDLVAPKERSSLLKVQDNLGRTAIHWAAVRGFTAALNCMLDSMSAAEQQQLLEIPRYGNLYTALDEAIKYQRYQTANVLSQYSIISVTKPVLTIKAIERPQAAPAPQNVSTTKAPEKQLEDLTTKWHQHQQLIHQKEQKITDLQVAVLELTVKLQESNKLRDEEINRLRSQLEINQSEINQLKTEHVQESTQLTALTGRLERQEEAIQSKDKQIKALQDTVDKLVTQLVGYEEHITQNDELISDEIRKMKGEIEENKAGISNLKDKMEEEKNSTSAETPTDSYTEAVMEEERPPTPSGEQVVDESTNSGTQESTQSF